jgi:hypothetical protein
VSLLLGEAFFASHLEQVYPAYCDFMEARFGERVLHRSGTEESLSIINSMTCFGSVTNRVMKSSGWTECRSPDATCNRRILIL